MLDLISDIRIGMQNAKTTEIIHAPSRISPEFILAQP